MKSIPSPFDLLAASILMVAIFVTTRLTAATVPPPAPAFIDGNTADQRMDALLHYCATLNPQASRDARDALIPCAARIYLGEDVPAMLQEWQEIAARVYGRSKGRLATNPKDGNARNPFEKHALIHAYLVCKDKAAIPPALVEVMKKYVELYKHRQWFGYGALNYRLMNDGAGFIAAELWPDLVDADGLDAPAIRAATKARLLSYFDDIVHHNTDEYGAPTYLGIDLSAVKMLADFAKDTRGKAASHAHTGFHAPSGRVRLEQRLLYYACEPRKILVVEHHLPRWHGRHDDNRLVLLWRIASGERGRHEPGRDALVCHSRRLPSSGSYRGDRQ